MPERAKRGAAWTKVAFGDVVRQVKDRVDPEQSGLERYVAGEHMGTDDLRLRRWGDIGDGYLGPAFHMRFKPGHVLYGSRRTYLRKVAVANFEGITANTTYVLEPKDPNVLLPELLPFIMQTEAFNQHSVRESKGSVNPYVNFSDLAWYEFTLPPIEVQRTFVRELRSHLGLVYSLGGAIVAGELGVRAMLNTAFPADARNQALSTISDLVAKKDVELKTGPFGTVLAASEYRKAGWPIVNPTEMKGGEIDHGDGPCVDDRTAARLTAYRLEPGDTLLARKGDFSKAVIAKEKHRGWIAGSDTIRLRSRSPNILAGYLFLCVRAPRAERLLLSHAHGTVMPGLNESILGSVPIEQRSPEEQERVVGIAEAQMIGLSALRSRHRAAQTTFRTALRECLCGNGIVL